jgi:glycerol uptake facilitator-like aquaporin
MRALGLEKAIFSAQGPAGLFGLMPAAGQDLGWAFFNEFIANTFLAILVFSTLDACNFFVSLSSAPFVIAMGYAMIVWSFS